MVKLGRNVKVQAFLDINDYVKLKVLMNQNNLKTDSLGINYVLRRYLKQIDEQDQAVNRLGKVIQDYERKIQNLEFELRQKNKVVKNEVKSK